MQVIVRDEQREFTRQTHAYAEYRAFACLAAHPAPVEAVTITLTRYRAKRRERVGCAIAATLRGGEVIDVEAIAQHPCAAVDLAVALIEQVRSAPFQGETCVTE